MARVAPTGNKNGGRGFMEEICGWSDAELSLLDKDTTVEKLSILSLNLRVAVVSLARHS